ncbi:MAG TPA: hypothetical protein VGC13_08565 [Longimicrobium sp.]|jgi:hypothetical protein|uniref:hypothetical protein n=1 Tax=Longimicrobium sp. TaxID=2029185 RepID=UPI002ED9ED24
MDADNIIRRLRAAVGNAVVWGAGWSALGFAAFTVLKVAGALPASAHWLDAILLAGRFGIVGGVAGAAFSGFIGVLYRGRRLSDLGAVRFGVAGAVLAGLFVPVFFQAMNVLTGDGMVPMGLVLDDVPWAALFGGVAAGVSLKLAQRAAPLLSGGSQDQPGILGSGSPFAWAGDRDHPRHTAPARRGDV